MESAREDQSVSGRDHTEKEKLARREHQNLLLSRSYVQRQLHAATNERYAQGLRHALAELDQKLAILEAEIRSR
jgi:hypothetical protein